MSRQENLKPQRLLLANIEITFYLWQEKRLNVEFSSAVEFDAWASSFVDTIVNVDRSEWDAFARWKFINTLLAERIISLSLQNGTEEPVYWLDEIPLEEKTSSFMSVDKGNVA